MTTSKPPTVTAMAPGRVNLIGEHTDYNGGLCLPFAIPLATTATLTVRTDRRLVIASDQGDPWTGTLDDIGARAVTGWASYVAGVLWALGDVGWDLPGGLDIDVSSTIPLGGGLSSSAALECAVAVAVAGLLELPVDRAVRFQLAEACRRAETEYVGAPTGGLDQLASLLGAEDHGVLVDFADIEHPTAEQVPLPLQQAGLTILVTDTGVRHSLADGDGGYAQRRSECKAFAADPETSDPVLIARGRHVRTENARVREAVAALASGDWASVGSLMVASHTSLRDDFEVSVPELDVAVEAAVQGGAFGARMTGGGFGGCSIALARDGDLDQVRAAIDRSYADQGWPTPRHHALRPGPGAALLSPGAPAPR